jgi:Protein of unknown function (DUF2934)
MKNNKFSQNQTKKKSNGTHPATAEDLTRSANDFAPSTDEVARRAYFAFENEGSKPGRDVQHWLAAEAELIAERNLTRVHGFHNQT